MTCQTLCIIVETQAWQEERLVQDRAVRQGKWSVGSGGAGRGGIGQTRAHGVGYAMWVMAGLPEGARAFQMALGYTGYGTSAPWWCDHCCQCGPTDARVIELGGLDYGNKKCMLQTMYICQSQCIYTVLSCVWSFTDARVVQLGDLGHSKHASGSRACFQYARWEERALRRVEHHLREKRMALGSA